MSTSSAKKILIVTTNIDKVTKDIPTGVYMEEFAVPYLTFKEAGYSITVASPKGGVSTIDPSSILCENPTEWDASKEILDKTESLFEVDYQNYDAIFLPGGHGPMFDLAKDVHLGQILGYFYESNKLIGAICHGVAGFITAKKADGSPLIQNKILTCFTNQEERIAKMEDLMPFLLESKLQELGAEVVVGTPYEENVIIDKNIITGQNPKSAQGTADAIWKILEGMDLDK